MKRRKTSAYTRSLTGGTRDVNPQFFVGRIATTEANAFTVAAYANPVAKGIFAQRGYGTVMEVLKIWVRMYPMTDIDNVAETVIDATIGIGTKDMNEEGYLDEPSYFFFEELHRIGAFTAGGTYSEKMYPVRMWDITDGAGHGVLVASDYIYVCVDTDGWPSTATFMFRILYRFKNIPVEEYVGIVQSQM